MKSVRIMGVCLIWGLALGAFGVGTASALPEVGRCQAKAGGQYRDAGCTEKVLSGGTFEFVKAAVKTGFKITGGEFLWEPRSGSKYICKTESGVGIYDLDSGVVKEVSNVVITLNGCSIPQLGIACSSKGAGPEEVVTNRLKGPLGYISGEKTKTPVVGLELTPETSKGPVADFNCGGGAVHVVWGVGTTEPTGNDCIISPLNFVNTMSTTFTLHYSGSAGEQKPQHFQPSTAKLCNLEVSTNGGAYERMIWAAEETFVNEEALEVKA
jgi:hypothetical protein